MPAITNPGPNPSPNPSPTFTPALTLTRHPRLPQLHGRPQVGPGQAGREAGLRCQGELLTPPHPPTSTSLAAHAAHTLPTRGDDPPTHVPTRIRVRVRAYLLSFDAKAATRFVKAVSVGDVQWHGGADLTLPLTLTLTVNLTL